MSNFDHLAGLAKHNSHMTPKSFTPVFEQHWSKSLIDDMISLKISLLGLHHTSMHEALPNDTPPGRSALIQLQPRIVEVLPAAPPPSAVKLAAASDHKTVIFAKVMDDVAF